MQKLPGPSEGQSQGVLPSPGRSAWRLQVLGLASSCGVLFGLLYALAVGTELGQRIDDAALDAALDTPGPDRAWPTLAASTSLHALGILVLVSLVVTEWLARARGHRRLGSMARWIVVGTVVLAEGSKHLLPRPDLGTSTLVGSFPSGHTAAAMALGLALLLVTPRSLRHAVHIGAPAFAATVAAGVVLLGWHRPSDAFAGVLLALGWGATVVGVRGHGARPRAAEGVSPVSLRFREPRARWIALLPFLAAGAAVVAAELALTFQTTTLLLRGATAFTALFAAGAVTLWERLVDPLVDAGRLE